MWITFFGFVLKLYTSNLCPRSVCCLFQLVWSGLKRTQSIDLTNHHTRGFYCPIRTWFVCRIEIRHDIMWPYPYPQYSHSTILLAVRLDAHKEIHTHTDTHSIVIPFGFIQCHFILSTFIQSPLTIPVVAVGILYLSFFCFRS